MTSREGSRVPGRLRLRQDYFGKIIGNVVGGDIYNLSQEAAIVASRVRHIFTPHQPIQPGETLTGRTAEIGKLIEVLNTPGQHVLLYGGRGVGKSSLANVVSFSFAQATTTPHYFVKRCDHTDTFESIFREPLAAAGVDVMRVEYVKQDTKARKKAVKLLDISVGKETQSGLSSTYRPDGTIGASEAARHLAALTGFMLIDELDVVKDPVARHKIAELIKQLSDTGSKFKLMLVGIAEMAADLTDAHPSIQRSLRETKLHVMSEDTLHDIVRKGGTALRLTFDEDVVATITRLSAGYPHFTHLLALKCAENAIRTGQARIGAADLPLAMATAVEDAEGTLRHSYSESIRSRGHAYRDVLVAAASLDGDEFTTAELRRAMASGHNPTGPLRQLVSADRETILRRIGKGVYRFADPRMRSYIRIIHLMIDPVA
jgi:Cdc6-like AAA superfamily ATPase